MTSDGRHCLFQLIVTTLGRPELAQLLESIGRQSVKDVHVVVADQSGGDDVAELCRRHESTLTITHLRSAGGASRGRNAGLRHIRAVAIGRRIVGFPDDDCWYPPTVLADVQALLNEHPEWDGCTGRSLTELGAPSAARWDRSSGYLTRRNVWIRGVTVTMFLRESLVACTGFFDETLGTGAGTPYGAGEETDYLLEALEHGGALVYVPALVVHHPDKRGSFDSEVLARSRPYGMGIGRVLAKRKYGLAFIAYMCLRPLGGAAVALARGRPSQARYHWETFMGRQLGARAAQHG